MPDEKYKPHYELAFHQLEREYFAAVHSDGGGGWNVHGLSMSSIVIFQGKIYLVDAAPDILYFLRIFIMLLELFTYLTTPCPPYVRNMGYLREAIGLKCRYKRHPVRWQPHLERTRQFILSAAGKCGNRGKVVILGSGFLLDTPLDELSAMFRDVVLIDIVCLPEIRRRIKRYGNVRFYQGDVTGIVETLYQNVSGGRRELPFAVPVLPGIDKDTGMVISLNIFSQLMVVPRMYALKKLPEIAKDRIDAWCRHIVEAHYAFLASLTCNVCLIADHRYSKHDRNGRITAQGSTLYGMSLPTPDDSWVWDIVPIGEESRHYSKCLEVGAWQVR